MLSQSYPPPAFALPQPRWARGLLLALAAHAALVLLFYWPQRALEPVELPPPAVMMSWAAQIEAPESKPLPLGVQQAESAAAQPAEQQQQPDLPKLARCSRSNRGQRHARSWFGLWYWDSSNNRAVPAMARWFGSGRQDRDRLRLRLRYFGHRRPETRRRTRYRSSGYSG